MKIVLVTSELTPYSTLDGMGEVVAQLANSLSELGHTVTVITPHYPQLESLQGKSFPRDELLPLKLDIRIGPKRVQGTVFKSAVSPRKPTILRISQPDYFDRPELYNDGSRDYQDNCERFVFLSRAAVELILQLQLAPDIVHCHDWQTGLVPALLKIEHSQTSVLNETASIISVHNIAFQGQFWHWDMELTGLDWKYFNWRQMEFFGQLNLLKTGIVFAEAITVSGEDFAKAVQTPSEGCGLHGVLRTRSEHVFGLSGGVEKFLEIYRQIQKRETKSALYSN